MTPGLRARIGSVIFETDSGAAKAFDVVLLVAILASVAAVVLETVKPLAADHGRTFLAVEWVFTILFTAEYTLRVYSARKRARYVFSFFGIVDLLAILPTYISLFIPGAQSLAVVRGLRLIRVFRVFKLARYVGEGDVLLTALRASRPKIIVFVVGVVTLIVVIGAVMYLVEGEEHGFGSIPAGIYWAIVTLTTVGYGDITPQTVPGKIIASCVMILGYAVIAVPTGIVTSEITFAKRRADERASACPGCGVGEHLPGARYCHACAGALD